MQTGISAARPASRRCFPFPGNLVGADGGRARAWVHSDDADVVPAGGLAMPVGLQRRLRLDPVAPQVTLELPPRFRLTVATPPALDLPPPATIHVSNVVYATFARRGRQCRAVVTTPQGLCVPVRLRKRPIGEGTALVPMSLRTLAGITIGSQVQLSAVPRGSWQDRRLKAVQRVSAAVPKKAVPRLMTESLGWGLLSVRLIDFCGEAVLRFMFGSRPLSFRIIQAHPGDDDLRDTIRLHPAAFTALDIRPGGQVLVDWAGERVSVRALEDHNPFGESFSDYVRGVIGVRYDPGPPQDFPPNLIARVPAPIRRHLGVPPNTIIVVRRRVRPALIGQLNQLTMPLAGLVLAAAAVPSVRGWPLVLGTLVAVFLGLAPLRRARPPKGPWP